MVTLFTIIDDKEIVRMTTIREDEVYTFCERVYQDEKIICDIEVSKREPVDYRKPRKHRFKKAA